MVTSILDIEGTVCPISFVKNTLFPYFLQEFESYLDSVSFPINKDQNEVALAVAGFPNEYTSKKESLVEHIKQLVEKDVKDANLKAFQGIVWKKGYEKGEIKAPLYKDAIEFIQTSSEPIYIYSSGSVAAQKLLFQHVDVKGQLTDLTKHLAGYFDITTAGSKHESSSYNKILEQIGKKGNEVIFYTDNVQEAKASTQAGLTTRLFIRPENPLPTEIEAATYITAHSF